MDFARELKRLYDEDWDFKRIARIACKSEHYRRTHRVAPTNQKRQKPLTGRGLCEIVRLLAMWCQRPVWRGQDSSERRFPRETGTLPARALQKAVHLMQPIKSLMRS